VELLLSGHHWEITVDGSLYNLRSSVRRMRPHAAKLSFTMLTTTVVLSAYRNCEASPLLAHARCVSAHSRWMVANRKRTLPPFTFGIVA